jgi:hypothetical protein
MAIDPNLLVPLDTIQAEFRAELGRFVDAFNALIETYVALEFASQAEVNAGAVTGKAVSPATLATHLTTQRFSAGTTSGGPSDGQRAPRLGAQGLLDASFLPRATPEQMAQGQNDTVLVTALSFAVEVSARIAAALAGRISAGPVSAGPADQGKAPVLNDEGQLDPSYLNPIPSLYIGAMDPTLPGGGLTPPIINGSNLHQAGAYAVVMVEGNYNFQTGLPSPTGTFLTPLDVVYFNGTTWDRIPNPMNINEFLRRDGSVPMLGDLRFSMPGRAGAELRIVGAIIECGTF